MIALSAFGSVPVTNGRTQHLLAALKQRGAGHVLEFGVWRGDTLCLIAERVEFIHGFDSFEGLPEPWDLEEEGKPTIAAGYFANPHWRDIKVPANGRLWVGMFTDTIPQWLAEVPGAIGFLHVDCDIYSSARETLFGLNSRIVPGTLIAFDELLSVRQGEHPRWDQHEWRAMNEWLTECNREAIPISRSDTERAAIMVTR